MMVAVHGGMIFPLVYSAVVGWRLSKAWVAPGKYYLVPYLSVMVVAGVATTVVVGLNKPGKRPGEEARKLPRKKAGTRRA